MTHSNDNNLVNIQARKSAEKARILYRVSLKPQTLQKRKTHTSKKKDPRKKLAKKTTKPSKTITKTFKKMVKKVKKNPIVTKSIATDLPSPKKSQVKVINQSAPIKSKNQAAQVLFQAVPSYPKVLQKRRVEGVTVVRLLIDSSHQASQFEIYQSSKNRRLDQEAIRAAKRSKYQAQINKKGANVNSYHKLLFRFTAP
ncbi:MAG: TonB family protein [Candidatus Cloacimonetes bacterium]|nr:TonB family protein [Candidatus Cloacimonadota bacterium]